MSIKVLISSTVHVILDNLFKHLNSNGGRRQLSSDIVDIDTKYSLRRSAFSGLVKQNVSCPFGNLVLSGGIEHVLPLFFTKYLIVFQNCFLSLL